MELIERYLQAVRKHLPWKRQDDILAELRANMESQLEDKEVELGRRLTEKELEEWLRTLGQPMFVASRYLPQQYLIGPTLYPMYLYVLRIALLWAGAIYTVVSVVVLPLTSPGQASVMDALLRAPGILINVAAWITLIFAALEFATLRHPGLCPPIASASSTWSPNSLPPLEKGDSGSAFRSFARAVAEIVFGFLALVWLLLIPKHPFLLLGPGVAYLYAGPFQLADIWWIFYWWIVALNVLQLVWRIADLMRGTWHHPAAIQQIVFKAFGLVPLVILLVESGGRYVLLKQPDLDQARAGGTLETINKSIHLGLLVIGAIASLQLVWDIGQALLRTYRQRAIHK